MKGYEKWLHDHMKSQDISPAAQPMYIAAMIAGFKIGREHSASFVEGFPYHKETGLGHLIRAIGNAEVDKDGKRLVY